MGEPAPDAELRSMLSPLTDVPRTDAAVRERVRSHLPESMVPPASRLPSFTGAVLGLSAGIAIGWFGHATFATPPPPPEVSAPVEQPAEPSQPEEEGREPTEAAPPQDAPQNTSAQNAPRQNASSRRNAPRQNASPQNASPQGRPANAQAPQERSSQTLERERRLLDAALAAWRDRNVEETQRFLDQHAREHREGVFTPEREALRERVEQWIATQP
ncbi:MAG: hypothetical protein AAGE52_41780 [Myxococcota bacterium]